MRFPVTRKTLVKSKHGDGSLQIWEDYKLILVPKPRLIWHLWYHFTFKHIFLVWLDLGARKMALTATEHWNEDHVRTRLMPLTSSLTIAWQIILKVSLKTKAAGYWIIFLLVFFRCYYLSKHWTWLNYIVNTLRFYNLYSGKFKFLQLARGRRGFEQKVSETDLCLSLNRLQN